MPNDENDYSKQVAVAILALALIALVFLILALFAEATQNIVIYINAPLVVPDTLAVPKPGYRDAHLN
jgi:hypothetical protein